MRIDALLYVVLGALPTLINMFGSDEAGKFIDPAILFYIKGFLAFAGAAAGAYKAFRSVSFARHLDRQADEARASGDTASLAKAKEQGGN